MLAYTVFHDDGCVLTSPQRPTHTWANPTLNANRNGRWTLERIQIVANLGSALLFVVGCLGFYSERHQASAITAFLIGSLLFLVSALGAAVAQHNSTRLADRHRFSRPSTNTPGEPS
jgi:drug/metabolite transporter (DMT)-like permease